MPGAGNLYDVHPTADIPPTQESQFIVEHGVNSSCFWKLRNDVSEGPNHMIRDMFLIAPRGGSQLSSSRMFLGRPK